LFSAHLIKLKSGEKKQMFKESLAFNKQSIQKKHATLHEDLASVISVM
jgi:hypothetical protein